MSLNTTEIFEGVLSQLLVFRLLIQFSNHIELLRWVKEPLGQI